MGKRRRSLDLPQGGNSAEIKKVKMLLYKAHAASIEPPSKKLKLTKQQSLFQAVKMMKMALKIRFGYSIMAVCLPSVIKPQLS